MTAFDRDNFPFEVDLSGSAQTQSRTTGLSSFIAGSDRRTVALASEDMKVTLSLADDPWLDDPHRAPFAPSETSLRKEAGSPRFEMQSELADGVDVFFELNGSSVTRAGVTERLAEAGGLFQPAAVSDALRSARGRADRRAAPRSRSAKQTDLLLSTFVAADAKAGRQATMQKIELTHRSFADIELRLGYGFMNEDGGFLGSEASGVFGGGQRRQVPLSGSVAGGAGHRTRSESCSAPTVTGLTEASGGSGLITDVSRLQSSAFGVGFSLADVVSGGRPG